jgi:hypothetical protein
VSGSGHEVNQLPRVIEVVRELLARGAALNARTNNGHTPLIDAYGRGQLAAATLLLVASADLALLDNAGSSALHCAEIRVELDDAEPAEGAEPPTATQRREHKALVALLKARGADRK